MRSDFLAFASYWGFDINWHVIFRLNSWALYSLSVCFFFFIYCVYTEGQSASCCVQSELLLLLLFSFYFFLTCALCAYLNGARITRLVSALSLSILSINFTQWNTHRWINGGWITFRVYICTEDIYRNLLPVFIIKNERNPYLIA